MILQRISIIVGDAGFEPRTSAPEAWCATNKPPHLEDFRTVSDMEMAGLSGQISVHPQLSIEIYLNALISINLPPWQSWCRYPGHPWHQSFPLHFCKVGTLQLIESNGLPVGIYYPFTEKPIKHLNTI